MLPSLRPREQMRSDLIGFLLYAIAEDPMVSEVSFKEGKSQETGGRTPWVYRPHIEPQPLCTQRDASSHMAFSRCTRCV